MRELKRTLAAVLAVAMIIGLFPHTAITARAEEGDGKSYETAIEISSGDTKTVSLSEEDPYRYFLSLYQRNLHIMLFHQIILMVIMIVLVNCMILKKIS